MSCGESIDAVKADCSLRGQQAPPFAQNCCYEACERFLTGFSACSARWDRLGGSRAGQAVRTLRAVQHVALIDVKRASELIVVCLLSCLENQRAKHDQGDNENDEPLPQHGLRDGYPLGEFLKPVADHNDLQRSLIRDGLRLHISAHDTLLVLEVHHLIRIAPEDDVADGIGVDLVPAVGHVFGDDGNIPGFDILQDTATNLSAVVGA